ncbi:MAG: phosphonoacetaldehyde reductase [Clostridiales bacterium]|nr:phosphonoacetaldehyde reductase [Clostridiales bacterium]
MQQTFYNFSAFKLLKNKKPLLVCDQAFDVLGIDLPCEAVRFSAFQSNPLYEDVEAGVEVLQANQCDFIVAIGGGSSIDTAKGIKYYSHTGAPVMAVPTTSGTGSEATHFAVLYKDGEKYSLADARLLPEYVVLLPEVLRTLPLYQKKCTMLDALCQAIESWWSRKATAQSIAYSSQAIHLILDHMDSYLQNEPKGNVQMLMASHLAGKAINITTTTAPHAMSYKMSSLLGLPHGHAVALCLPKVWAFTGGFDEIAKALGREDCQDAVAYLEGLLQGLGIFPPDTMDPESMDRFVLSVNTERLQNHPIELDQDAIKAIYEQVFNR